MGRLDTEGHFEKSNATAGEPTRIKLPKALDSKYWDDTAEFDWLTYQNDCKAEANRQLEEIRAKDKAEIERLTKLLSKHCPDWIERET